MHCDHCQRPIKHTNLIKNTLTNEIFYLGGTCTANFTGKTVKEINDENSDYETEVANQTRIASEFETRKVHVKRFVEANADMMVYIENKLSNSFIKSMKERIEKEGTLTPNMYSVIYSMMLPVAQLDTKIKDLEVQVIRFSKKEGQYGWSYTLFCETQDGELVRVFFSSIDKYEELLQDKKIIDRDGMIYENILDRKPTLKVSGSFDGYKVKRAKILA